MYYSTDNWHRLSGKPVAATGLNLESSQTKTRVGAPCPRSKATYERLLKDADGGWRADVAIAPGTHHYRFMVDGQWQDDPESTLRMPNPYGGQNHGAQG